MYEEVLKTLSLPTKERRTDRLRLILPWLRRMSELMVALSEGKRICFKSIIAI